MPKEKITITNCENCKKCIDIQYLQDTSYVLCQEQGTIWFNENFVSFEKKDCKVRKLEKELRNYIDLEKII